MKTIYRCSECGEDYKHESPTAEISNIGTVNELIYHLDPCPICCNDKAECDRIFELEQENSRLKATLHNIEEGLKRLDILVLDGAVIKEGFGNTIELVKYAPMSSCRALMRIEECSSLTDLIDKILTGGE